MLEIIIKRDGTEEAYDEHKVNSWMQWAGKDLNDRINWSGIVMSAVKDAPSKMSSQDLQLALVQKCVEKRDWPHNLMGGKLYAVWHWKNLYGEKIPTVLQQHEMLANLGVMQTLEYTYQEYEEIEKMVDHTKDLNLAHFQVKQIIYKYSLANRVSKQQYETPQFIFIRMAMALAESSPKAERLDDVNNWYKLFSESKVNAPTPNFNNLGTLHNGYASCCLYKTNDDRRSLAAGDHIAYTMTYMSAGVGGFIDSRSSMDPVRNGTIQHSGKLPYFQSAAKAVKANTQGGRGGALTEYVSVFDPEIETIIMLQNPRTSVEIQNRDIHFAVMVNSFFAKKVGRREVIFTFNCYTAPDLHEKLFSSDREGFAELYAKYENDPLFKKNYIDAYKLCVNMETQGHEVSTLYMLDIEECNRHTPFKDPIYSSNLCIETIIPTKGYTHVSGLYSLDHHDGEIGLCNLGGIVVPKIKNDTEYEQAAYYALKMADRTIDLGHYELPHLGYTAKKRRNAAIGMVGIAEYFAKRGIKYDSPYGLQVAHELAERHMYFLIKASLKLGKELGNAEWMFKTKWADGILPIDTYKKNVDQLVPHVLKYDWESLRKEIVANGGIRNSSLVAHMPTESSSKASGSPNGLYPVRGVDMKKTDLGNTLDWVVPDGDLYGDNYQIAYDIDTNDLVKFYAVIQKFTDQGISADFYMDRTKKKTLTENELVEHFLNRIRYGLKSKYYQNSLTDNSKMLSNETSANTDFSPNEKVVCGSGGCVL